MTLFVEIVYVFITVVMILVVAEQKAPGQHRAKERIPARRRRQIAPLIAEDLAQGIGVREHDGVVKEDRVPEHIAKGLVHTYRRSNRLPQPAQRMAEQRQPRRTSRCARRTTWSPRPPRHCQTLPR